MPGPYKKLPYIITICICLFCLFPFIYLSRYNHPQSDDFFNAVRNRKNSFFETQIKVYNNISGRYSSTTSSYLNPLLGKLNLTRYRLFSFVLILLIIVSLYILIYQLYKPYLTYAKLISLTSIFVALYFLDMPSISEGLYWFSGYMTYQIPSILTLFFLSIIVRINSGNSINRHLILKSISFILVILIIGFNSISLIILDTIVILLNLIYIIRYKRLNLFYALLFTVILIFSLLFILSPGNFQRLGEFQYSGNFMLSLITALGLTCVSFLRWGLMLIIFSAVFIYFLGSSLKKMKERNLFSDLRFNQSFIFFISILFLMYFIYAWLTGSKPVGRADNVFYLFFIIGWFFNLYILLLNSNKFQNIKLFEIKQDNTFLILFIYILIVFSINNNISTAYIDIISGKAKKYDNELLNRYEIINECKTDTCIVPAIENIPRSLFFKDIASINNIEGKYINKSYARYFNKKYITVMSSNSSIQSNHETLEEYLRKVRDRIDSRDKK